MARMRLSSKNMCSVRHRPMPSAPNSRAWRASRGVSALARTPSGAPRRPSPSAWRSRPTARAGASCTRPSSTSPVPPSMVMTSPLRKVWPADRHGAGLGVDAQRAGAAHAGPAHAARDHGGVAGHAAARGEDAGRGVHAVDVLGAGLDAHQDDLAALAPSAPRPRRRRRRSRRRRRRARPAGRSRARACSACGIDGRVQQLVERRRLDAHHRLLAA